MKKSNLHVLIVGVLLFILSLIFDKNVNKLTDLIKNPLLDLIFNWFTKFINVFLILILVTTLFLWEERRREWIFPLWLSFILSIAVSLILKLILAKPRPSAELLYHTINTLNYSFPSMHAAVAFAALPLLNREFKKMKWFWIIFAVLVALSRVYFGFHFLSDVIFGAFVGYFIGILAVYAEEKYHLFKFLK